MTGSGGLTLNTGAASLITIDAVAGGGGVVVIGQDSDDSLSIVGTIATSLIPTGLIDIGSPSASWQSIFASSTIHAGESRLLGT